MESKEAQLERYLKLKLEHEDCWCRGTGRIFSGDSNCPHGWQNELDEIEKRAEELLWLLSSC